MRTANTVTMVGDLDTIVKLAGDTERWPVLLPHYRWVTLLAGGGDRKTIEMAARRGRIPVKWRAVQEIDRRGATPVINFTHVGGVTKGMEVSWVFVPSGNGIDVTIDHDFEPPWPVVGDVVADRIIGPHFIEAIAGKTLATIKAIDCALADEDGEITLFLPSHNRGETSMRIVNADADGAKIRVPARTLLGVVEAEGYAKIDAMKLDVEGAEDLIIEPFFRKAPKALWPKLVLMEHTNARWAIDLPKLMRDCGYAEILRTRANVAYERA